LYFLELFLSSS